MEKITCKKCKKTINENDFYQNLKVCPKCGFHDIMNARERILSTADMGSFVEFAENITSVDFLNFYDLKSYNERLSEAKQKSGLNEAIITGEATIKGIRTSICVMDFNFMGGSMGSVVGEKIKIAVENSISKKIPLIIFTASGGARMQEGIISLMQMAKTVSCINRLKENNIPYFCVITHPTTGGVSASFATIADIIITEPGALFCFAGPRVVEQTIKKEIPQDFGLAQRNLKNGQVDIIAQRKEINEVLALLLSLFTGQIPKEENKI
ncbi:MAG: acetyl-CoA carboxylase, carboxyltransferase subunit beta [Actinobacteria bacterium]|nr:acetyl-CoA carboxylase, carboxyltransferase subunit beta [Actinomycetota bacterium]